MPDMRPADAAACAADNGAGRLSAVLQSLQKTNDREYASEPEPESLRRLNEPLVWEFVGAFCFAAEVIAG